MIETIRHILVTRWQERAVRRAMRRTLAITIRQLTPTDYAASHSLPDVEHWPPLDLDIPPYFAKHSAPVVDGMRVLGRKQDD